MHDPRDLLGRWSLDREITDVRTGRTGYATGILTISAEREDLRWDEEVSLTWGGRTGPAWRHYRLRRRGGVWWMTFGDGSPFHRWTPGVDVVHPCAEDTYRGRVTVVGPAFGVRWRVTGPGKDLSLVTRLTRAAR